MRQPFPGHHTKPATKPQENNPMPRTYSALTATIMLLSAFAAPLHAEIIDSIIATVDNEIILRSDILLLIEPYIERTRLQATTEQEYETKFAELIRVALEENINTKLLYRAALLAGLQEISDEQVEKEVERIRKSLDYGTLQEFVETLKENGLTMSEFKQVQRKGIMASSMISHKRRTFRAEVSISETQMAEFYEQHREAYTKPERIQLRQIFLKKIGKNTSENARVRSALEDIQEQLKANADFEELARTHSQAIGAQEGGKFGVKEWHQPTDLEVGLQEITFLLPVGGVSDIYENQFGFQLLKVVKKEEKETVPMEEARSNIEEVIRETETDKKYNKWLDDLRKRSGVRIFL